MNKPNTEIITFQGGKGSSVFDAVEIVGAQNFISGIKAEFEFIRAVFGESEIESAEGKVIFFSNSIIHQVNIVTKKGDIKNIFFDASKFQDKIENEPFETVNVFTLIN